MVPLLGKTLEVEDSPGMVWPEIHILSKLHGLTKNGIWKSAEFAWNMSVRTAERITWSVVHGLQLLMGLFTLTLYSTFQIYILKIKENY